MNLKLSSFIDNAPTPGRAYQPILVDGFGHSYQKFIYLLDDRKPIIAYAITIAAGELNLEKFADT